jgi:hypothetical protein
MLLHNVNILDRNRSFANSFTRSVNVIQGPEYLLNSALKNTTGK